LVVDGFAARMEPAPRAALGQQCGAGWGRPGGAITRPALPQGPTKVQATAGIAAPKNHDFCLIPVFSSFWPIEKRM